jgi:hypothetical protein
LGKQEPQGNLLSLLVLSIRWEKAKITNKNAFFSFKGMVESLNIVIFARKMASDETKSDNLVEKGASPPKREDAAVWRMNENTDKRE